MIEQNHFLAQCQAIEEEIWKSYTDDTQDSEPIIDGIVNTEKYLKSEIKILWILKEAYDDVKDGLPCGGGWHYCKDFLAPTGFYTRIKQSHPTWHPIIYVNYGILNNFIEYEKMDYIRDDLSMADIVQNVAIINIKKLPGLTRSYDYTKLYESYIAHKKVLLKQIDTYNPDVIIGGSTLQLFFDDLSIRDKIIKKGSLYYASLNSKLFISAYHPAQTTITRDIYVNDIIRTTKDWFMQKI